MKSFQFRLDTVLRLRQQQVETEQLKLHQLLAEQDQLKKCLELVAREREEAAHFVREHQAPGNRDLRALASYILGSQARAVTIQSALQNLNRALAEQKAVVVRAKQKEELMIKLREKRTREWMQEANRQMEAESQECWTASWQRARTEPRD